MFSVSFQGTDRFVHFCCAAALFCSASPHSASPLISTEKTILCIECLPPPHTLSQGVNAEEAVSGQRAWSQYVTLSPKNSLPTKQRWRHSMFVCLCRVWSWSRDLHSVTAATHWVHNPLSSASNRTRTSSG